MNKRRFKKAARKAWKLIQGQRSARLTPKESQALDAYARAFPSRVASNWMLVKDGRPRYLRKHKLARTNPTLHNFVINDWNSITTNVLNIGIRFAVAQ